MNINFIKCHGSGNDFVLIDETVQEKLFSNEKERTRFTRQVCGRGGMIGADGVLFLGNSRLCDFAMRMFNPDGSEAEMCGNGIRCAGRLASEKLGENELTVEVMGKTFHLKKENEIFDGVKTCSVKIEAIVLDPALLPVNVQADKIITENIPQLSNGLLFTAVGMPNPHLIAFVADMTEAAMDQRLQSLGQKVIELKGLFPKGINVSLSKETGRQQIFTRTYERGAGLTNSCGTAMCASALTYALRHPDYFNSWITVANKGGMVQCFVEQKVAQINVRLLGNATFEYGGAIHYEADEDTIEKVCIHPDFPGEVQAYHRWVKRLSGQGVV